MHDTTRWTDSEEVVNLQLDMMNLTLVVSLQIHVRRTLQHITRCNKCMKMK